MRIHYQYLRDSNNHVVACISSVKSSKTDLNDSTETVTYNISMRNQADPIDKKLSMRLAKERMEKAPRVITLPKGAKHKDIATAIMNDIINARSESKDSDWSTWFKSLFGKVSTEKCAFSTSTRNAAKAWLKKSPKNRGV